MIEQKLYQHLFDLVHAFGPIFTSLPSNLKSIKTFTSYLPIVFEANIIIMDLNQKYYFRISLEDYYIKKRNFDFCRLNLIGDSSTWINIFTGKETLMGAFNLGKIIMTNVREQYILRIALLSGIFFNFAMKKQRMMRAGKYLKFPLFSKQIFTPIFKILVKVLGLIPKHIFERIIKKISPLLEEE